MMIVGCDFHPSWEQVAWLDIETRESGERKLVHAAGEAQGFYSALAAPAVAAARKLAVRLYWMLRTQTAYPEIVRTESSLRVPLAGAS